MYGCLYAWRCFLFEMNCKPWKCDLRVHNLVYLFSTSEKFVILLKPVKDCRLWDIVGVFRPVVFSPGCPFLPLVWCVRCEVAFHSVWGDCLFVVLSSFHLLSHPVDFLEIKVILGNG